jgi:hypothetical protein
MEFYLKYDGPLVTNGNAIDKQKIRLDLHPQMKRLWDIPPLKGCKFLEQECEPSILKKIGNITFAPLVSSVLKLICQLDITIL